MGPELVRSQEWWYVDMPACRGVRSSADGEFVLLMGSPFSNTMEMGDVTLRSRGSTDTFVAKLTASDGSGVWTTDGARLLGSICAHGLRLCSPCLPVADGFCRVLSLLSWRRRDGLPVGL